MLAAAMRISALGPPWQMGPDFMRREPELAPNSVIIPSKCNPHRPSFFAIATECFPNSPELHANATHIRHDFGQVFHTNATQHRPNSTQMQPVSLQNSSELHSNSNQICPEFGQHSLHMQTKPSEFHANIGGGTAHKERACVEVVHTKDYVWMKVHIEGVMCGGPHIDPLKKRGSTKKTIISARPPFPWTC